MERISLSERLGLIKAAISGGSKQSVLNSLPQSLIKFMPMYGQPPKNSDADWIKTYNLSPRMNPIHQIASDIACADYCIHTKDKVDQKLLNHPLYALLDRPCEDISITLFGLMYITQVYLMLPTGEAFWLKERNKLGIPTQLWPVPPNWVAEIPSRINNYFRVQPLGNMDATPIHVLPEDMVYFKKLDVSNPYLRGRGRLEAIGDEIETDEYMAKFNKKYFYNNAIPNMVGMMPGADSTAIERAQESWNQKYGGYNNAHKMAWLGWDAKIQILKETYKEMDFIESRKYLRDTSNQHFSIPPEIFGILENSNRSTIDSAYYLYSKNVLHKELKCIEDVINRQLLPDFGVDAVFEYENVVPEDNEFDLRKANEGLSRGAITVDEWRTANGLEILPEGKGQILYIPGSVIATDIKGPSLIPVTPLPEPEISEKPSTEEAQVIQPKK